MQVPGSWKVASVKYKWVERAAAYDERRIDEMVDGSIDDLLDGPALAFNRVMLLKTLLERVRTNINSNAKGMSLEQFCMMVQRMQSLTKQIADEMASYDETITRALLRHICIPVYHKWEPPSTKADYEKIIEQTGGTEKTLKAIEQEQTRRR